MDVLKREESVSTLDRVEVGPVWDVVKWKQPVSMSDHGWDGGEAGLVWAGRDVLKRRQAVGTLERRWREEGSGRHTTRDMLKCRHAVAMLERRRREGEASERRSGGGVATVPVTIFGMHCNTAMRTIV